MSFFPYVSGSIVICFKRVLKTMRENSTPIELETLAADISNVLLSAVLADKALSKAQEQELKAVVKSSLQRMEIGDVDIIAILEGLLLDEIAMDGLARTGLYRNELAEFLEQIKTSDGVLETAAGPRDEALPELVMSEGAHFVDNEITSPTVEGLDMEGGLGNRLLLDEASGLARFAQRAGLAGLEGQQQQKGQQVDLNNPPVLDGSLVAPSMAYAEGADAVPLFKGLKVSDPDGDVIEGATFRIDNVQPGDELSLPEGYDLPDGLKWNYDPKTGVGTLSGSAPAEVYEDVLQNVSYRNTSSNPGNYGDDPTRRISAFVNDNGDQSDPVTSTVNIAGVNDAPVIDDSAVTDGTYTEGGTPAAILDGVELSDVDNRNMESAWVQINNVRPGDELVFKPGL